MASDSTRSPRNSRRSLPCGKAAFRSGRLSSVPRWVSASTASSARLKEWPSLPLSDAKSTSPGVKGPSFSGWPWKKRLKRIACWPFPRLQPAGCRGIVREEDELGAADQVLGRHVPAELVAIARRAREVAQHEPRSTVERIVAVVAHDEVVAGRHQELRRVVGHAVVGVLEHGVGAAVGQRLACRACPSGSGRWCPSHSRRCAGGRPAGR